MRLRTAVTILFLVMLMLIALGPAIGILNGTWHLG